MKAGRGLIEELCFAAEGLSGAAASSSLRKLGSLVDQAPSGRLFGAISTLADASAKAARALEEGNLSLTQDDETAATRLGEALIHMDDLAELSSVPAAASARRRATR